MLKYSTPLVWRRRSTIKKSQLTSLCPTCCPPPPCRRPWAQRHSYSDSPPSFPASPDAPVNQAVGTVVLSPSTGTLRTDPEILVLVGGGGEETQPECSLVISNTALLLCQTRSGRVSVKTWWATFSEKNSPVTRRHIRSWRWKQYTWKRKTHINRKAKCTFFLV